jgi:hypothetical protein
LISCLLLRLAASHFRLLRRELELQRAAIHPLRHQQVPQSPHLPAVQLYLVNRRFLPLVARLSSLLDAAALVVWNSWSSIIIIIINSTIMFGKKWRQLTGLHKWTAVFAQQKVEADEPLAGVAGQVVNE